MDRPSVLTALLVLVGVALVAVPVVAPAEEPPDRIEYYTETTDHQVSGWETLHYENFSERERRAFDATLANESGYYNPTADELGTVPPFVSDTVAVYDVRYEGRWYLLQAKYFDTEVPAEDHLVRLGALVGGVLLATAGGYRAVTA